MDLEKLRVAWAKNDAKRDNGLKPSKNIIEYTNIKYGEKERWNLLDIYTPNTSLDKYPVILSIHGGGWFYGDKELYKLYTTHISEKGFAVVNMNYSLAPESKYPTPIYEIISAINFITNNKEKYHLDMDNFFIVGDSAGAQLCHQIATIISNKEYTALFNIKINNNFKLKAIALNCGVYSLGVLPIIGPISMIKDYLPSDYKKYSETYKIKKYMTSNFPKTYIMSGCDDFLKLFLKPMTKTLKKHGVYTVSKLYGKKGIDKCPHVFHLDLRNPVGMIANDDELKFFKDNIK